ncbi:MAG: zf-HC2 domain-containing protein [Gemmatimonadetes bacterium]|nr:zf-HC2 domain-containing protein [Gemmatimonadota bacterium]
MSTHIDEARLNDFLEGLLSREDEAEVQEHLAACHECKATMQSLRGLTEELAELPVEAEPGRDLWPDIATRIEFVPQGVSDVEVVPIEAYLPPERRRRSFSLWQVAAASVAMAIISGASVWYILGGGGLESGPTVADLPTSVRTVAFDAAVSDYEAAVTDLEALLDVGSEVLEPGTVLVLEENLRIIDTAIDESRRALADDPASELLGRILTSNMRWKLALLRQATALINREA